MPQTTGVDLQGFPVYGLIPHEIRQLPSLYDDYEMRNIDGKKDASAKIVSKSY